MMSTCNCAAAAFLTKVECFSTMASVPKCPVKWFVFIEWWQLPCVMCDLHRQGQMDGYSDASKGFWLDMMKACNLRGAAGQPGLQMAAERLINIHLAHAEELMATSRREHARAEVEVLEAQKVSTLTLSLSLQMLFVSTVE